MPLPGASTPRILPSRTAMSAGTASLAGKTARAPPTRGQRCVCGVLRPRRAAERARLLLRQEPVALTRGGLRDEVVGARCSPQDRGHLVRQAAVIELLLGRDVGIEHGPAIFSKECEQSRNVLDRGPADLA